MPLLRRQWRALLVRGSAPIPKCHICCRPKCSRRNMRDDTRQLGKYSDFRDLYGLTHRAVGNESVHPSETLELRRRELLGIVELTGELSYKSNCGILGRWLNRVLCSFGRGRNRASQFYTGVLEFNRNRQSNFLWTRIDYETMFSRSVS